MKHVLPPLPYDYTALEPYIDAKTMMLHHDKHHASYVENLNAALEHFPGLQERTALWLLLNLDKVPEGVRVAVYNNAGGHVNHSLFWGTMHQAGSGTACGPLLDAINRDFGSLDKFKVRFEEAGAKVFGSGWVWLARAQRGSGELHVYTTSGHDNPLTQGHFPILVNDVWEHAYYLKYENRRADYLKGWWPLVNWKEVARRFERSDQFADQEWEGEGEAIHSATA
jgi:superoxide dismutase, Fe-Mn family